MPFLGDLSEKETSFMFSYLLVMHSLLQEHENIIKQIQDIYRGKLLGSPTGLPDCVCEVTANFSEFPERLFPYSGNSLNI